MSTILQHYLTYFLSGRELRSDDSEVFFDALISETDEQLLTDLLHAWSAKGATENEIFDLTGVMRSRMKRINSLHPAIVDIVGTGGSRGKTFNVSTAAAFVVSGAGIPVAKHGNRAATSNTGSADVLSSLGINVDLSPEAAEKCLNEIGICFMFAPRFHSLSPTLAKVRREIGRPTIFNSLGPLCNPARAKHQLIGVWSNDLVEKVANALARLGATDSWVVHGENGLDEITLNGKTTVAEVCDGKVTRFDVSSAHFGVQNDGHEPPTAINTGESAELIRRVMGNEFAGQPAEKLVLMNAAAAIKLAGLAEDLPRAFQIAEESVRSGNAAKKLRALADATNQ